MVGSAAEWRGCARESVTSLVWRVMHPPEVVQSWVWSVGWTSGMVVPIFWAEVRVVWRRRYGSAAASFGRVMVEISKGI